MKSVDFLIVGAGPAGMAAATTARHHGLDVLVVDDQPTPGGQIWRAVERLAATPRGRQLGAAYGTGLDRTAAFRACGADYAPGGQVWQIEPGFRVFLTRDGKPSIVTAKSVLLAVGAQERPVPFPGWTLPGVLTVGAAQILLKTSGQIPEKPVWVAGSGPLTTLYMAQLLKAGGKIAGVLDTTPRGRIKEALPHLPGALRSAGELAKGLGWVIELRRAGIPIVRHVAEIVAEGDGRLQVLRYQTDTGQETTVPAEVLLVHEGIVPSIHAPLALGCEVEWNPAQHSYAPVVDEWGETSQTGIFVAGDAAGIAGANAAVLRGRLAALKVGVSLARLDQRTADAEAVPLRRRLARELALRPFLDVLFAPRPQVFAPRDETIVCRCEEVTARELRAKAAMGRSGMNQIKAFTRAGMGPCQGRQCGYTIAHLIAEVQKRPVSEVGFFRIRPPLKPITLGELASLDEPGSV